MHRCMTYLLEVLLGAKPEAPVDEIKRDQTHEEAKRFAERRERVAAATSMGLSAAKINALLRRWLALLPHPFSRTDRRAGFRYELSILQSEFALTQVLDRPLSGRIFFERVIRDNIDLGRPRNVQLIFDRRIQKSTPSRFRSRVMTQGVVPSLWIDYKSSTVK